jgi:hypothetical protein
MVHGLKKKSEKVPRADIEKAIEYRKDYLVQKRKK